jgi:hypothetical protein
MESSTDRPPRRLVRAVTTLRRLREDWGDYWHMVFYHSASTDGLAQNWQCDRCKSTVVTTRPALSAPAPTAVVQRPAPVPTRTAGAWLSS